MGRSAHSLAFETGIDQANRALILQTPLGAQALLPQRVVGESRIGRDFEFTVDVVSRERAIELKKLMAQPVTLWVRQRDSAYLPYHGFVFATRRLGSEGGFTYYQLSFSSWMRFLRHRKDARIFQDATTADILTQVFDGHSLARGQYRFDVAVNDRRYGAKPGSAYWRHLRIGVKEPVNDRRNGATSGSP
jgi:type VI secretion system secreted protein VgrG